jgi:hypothetical protein
MLRTSFLLEDPPPCQGLIDIEVLLAFLEHVSLYLETAGWLALILTIRAIFEPKIFLSFIYCVYGGGVRHR